MANRRNAEVKAEWAGTLPSGKSRWVYAGYDDLDDAADAARDLEHRGFDREQISVFMTTETRERYVDTHPRYDEFEKKVIAVEDVEVEKQRKTLEGVGAGGTIGGALGAAGAAIAAVGTTLVVPPLGIAVAGPLAAILAGAGAGATAGGIMGALVGAGMTEYRARHLEKMVKEGNVVVGAGANTDAERTTIVEVLEKHGGKLVQREPEDA